MPTIKQLYRLFLKEHDHCWGCGRSGRPLDRPGGWFGPWQIERHHIVSKPRVEDPRAIAPLCTICHRVAHGDRLIVDGERWHLPRLMTCHLLFLKRLHDPTRYDRAWLKLHCIGRLPSAKRPPVQYVREYQSRQILWV
jgi:hypothetical protein